MHHILIKLIYGKLVIVSKPSSTVLFYNDLDQNTFLKTEIKFFT